MPLAPRSPSRCKPPPRVAPPVPPTPTSPSNTACSSTVRPNPVCVIPSPLVEGRSCEACLPQAGICFLLRGKGIKNREVIYDVSCNRHRNEISLSREHLDREVAAAPAYLLRLAPGALARPRLAVCHHARSLVQGCNGSGGQAHARNSHLCAGNRRRSRP